MGFSQSINSQCGNAAGPTGPLTHQSTDPPIFRWVRGLIGPGCVRFQIGIQVPVFCPIININPPPPVISYPPLSDTCVLLSNSSWNYFFATGITYCWAMRTEGGNLTWVNLIGSSINRIQAALPPVNLITPPNAATGIGPTPMFKWSNISGATSYYLEIYSDKCCITSVFDSSTARDSIQIPAGVLAGNTTYYWRVKPYQTGGEGPFSDPYYFTTAAFPLPPPPPGLVSPLNGTIIQTTTPLLDWDSIPAANTYHVSITDTTVLSAVVFDSAGIPLSRITVPPGILQPNNLYMWAVRGYNAGGYGPWSATWNFRVAPVPYAPNLVAPLNGSQGISPTPLLDWDSIAIASSYVVQVSRNSVFTNIVLDSSGIIYSSLRIPSGRLTPDSVYYWRVKGVNGVGQGPWSTVWSFRVSPLPPAPNLVFPPNGTSGHSITPLLDWDSIAVANNYQAQVSKNSVFTNIVADSNGIIYSSMRVRSGVLQNESLYYWRVRGNNISGQGPWSAIWSFRVGYVGLTQISDKIPQKFDLKNNYPNPFNPITKIRFDIAKTGNVKILIYDVLGREISVLVNIRLEPGTYETEFDGGKYSSGIYYFRLESEYFVNTKKMVLVK